MYYPHAQGIYLSRLERYAKNSMPDKAVRAAETVKRARRANHNLASLLMTLREFVPWSQTWSIARWFAYKQFVHKTINATPKLYSPVLSQPYTAL